MMSQDIEKCREMKNDARPNGAEETLGVLNSPSIEYQQSEVIHIPE